MSEPFFTALMDAKKTMQPQRLQLYFSKIDKWYEDLIYPSTDGVSVYYHDITERKKAEISLEIAHEKLSYHLSNTPMAVVEFDTNAQIKKWNRRAEEIFGWTEEEIMNMGRVMHTLVFEDDVDIVENSITNLTHMQQRQGFLQLRNYTKQGHIIYCEWYNSVLRDSEGNINGILSLVQDISSRYLATKAIEESKIALQKSNERFEKVAAATNDAIWDWDLQHNTIWGNDAFCKLFEAEPESEFSMEDFSNRIHPEDREWVMQVMNEVFRKRETFANLEFRLTLSNKLQYITVNDKAHIQYNRSGEPIRLLGALQDITQQKLYEQNILLEKELSDSIINSLPGIFYLFNKEGQMYRWNKNMEWVTGYSAEELKTLQPIQLIAKQDKELVQQKMDGVFRDGDDYVEAYLETKDGQHIPFYFTGRIINYEGEPCLVGVGLDISEKVKSQDELEKSEERYRTLIEQASDGIFISDFQGKYIDVNSNGLRLSGYSKEELMHLTIYDLMAPGDEINNPVRLNELMLGNVVINERKMKRKDGALLNVEISAKLLADGRFLGIVRDITARKQAEEELKNSEEKYRLLFHKNPMPMWMLSLPERKFLDVNDAAIEIYGYTKEEFLRMDIWDIRPKDDKKQLKEALAKLKDGQSYNGIWKHLKKDGSTVRVNIISHDIMYNGNPAKLVLASDITARLEAEERLQESHEAYKQLATHLETVREAERTHIAREIHDELGQQLTGLKMDISWLSKRIKLKDGEVQQKIRETISLIDGTVKTVRRIATELRPSILDDLGLVPAMEWQSEEFEKRSGIHTDFSSNIATIDVDPDLATAIFRIYQESLTNVMRHADASKVKASLTVDAEKIRLTIQDDGKGFLVEEIANKKTLGLMGMRERATLLGGSYQIDSELSSGTSVNIIVPFKN
jgi:PAS domain S-box-containing protein